MEELFYKNDYKKIDIWKIFWYFIIYSIVGFLLETTFAIFTKGVIESRQSFLYGPFCMIYGVGAIAMILCLKKVKNGVALFFGGAFIGGIVEYFGSLIGEVVLGVKWWDYSDLSFNIHGRTCLFYLVCWGILSILLIKYINPKIDNIIKYLKGNVKVFKFASSCIVAFLVFDVIVTGYAIKAFYIRVAKEHNLDVNNKFAVNEEYNDIYSNINLSNIIYKYFNDERMLKTYPNIIIEDSNNNIIQVEGLLSDIQSYYLKLGKKE